MRPIAKLRLVTHTSMLTHAFTSMPTHTRWHGNLSGADRYLPRWRKRERLGAALFLWR